MNQHYEKTMLHYEDALCKIKKEIRNNSIWMSINETIDVQGCNVTCVINNNNWGSLSPEKSIKPIVLTVENLEKVNFQIILKSFNNSMNIMWPEKVLQYDKILLHVTDAVFYIMIKSGQTLKVFYLKLVDMYVMYVSHGLHKISEAISNKFPKVDKLVSNRKNVFLKAPALVNTSKEICPKFKFTNVNSLLFVGERRLMLLSVIVKTLTKSKKLSV